jgi:hypothetical protein
MWNRLVDLGQAGDEILAAWIAKEELRTLLSLARTGASRHQISHRLWTFYQWCADTNTPELHRLARTIQAWWPQIEAYILSGITNAASEGVNRLIKLEARNAFGFRNPTNQRLRSRCVGGTIRMGTEGASGSASPATATPSFCRSWPCCCLVGIVTAPVATWCMACLPRISVSRTRPICAGPCANTWATHRLRCADCSVDQREDHDTAESERCDRVALELPVQR